MHDTLYLLIDNTVYGLILLFSLSMGILPSYIEFANFTVRKLSYS